MTSQAFGGLALFIASASVADMIVVGNLVGVDALTGVAAVLPVIVGAQFVSRLVYGAGYLFAKYQGRLEPEKARRVVGLSIETAVFIGLVIFAVTALGRDLYLDAMGLSGAVREQAIAYWRWIFVYYAIFPLRMTISRLVYADGETVTTTVADTFGPPFSLVLSVLFTKLTGTAAGAALGVLVGMIASDFIRMSHVFRKSNGIVPIWGFSWRELREIVSYSLTDSLSTLCQCVYLTVVSKLVVYSASAAYLPVVSMLALVQQLVDSQDRIGDAYMPVAEMYKGERNLSRLGELARHALTCSLVLGVLMVAAVELLAPQIVSLYGIPRGDVFDSAVVALRISAIVLPLSSVLLFLSSHHLVLDRIRLSLANTVSAGFVLTVGCTAAFCFAWGLEAMWIGLPFGALLTLVAIVVYCRMVELRCSPLLIPEAPCAVLNLTFVPDEREVVRARDAGARFLREQGVSGETVSRIMLLIEECSLSVVDVCRRTRSLLVEASLIVDGETVTLVLRDTGTVRDVTDWDAQVTSLRSFVIAGLMRSYENRRYLNTIGCNRAVFSFPLGR